MSRRKQPPPRPAHDFTVTSVAWTLEIVQNHTRAGFEHVPDAAVCRDFFLFVDLLQREAFTVRTVAASLAEVTAASALRNSDLTEEGFRFVQYALPRWETRLYKDRGSERTLAFLERWLQRWQEQEAISRPA